MLEPYWLIQDKELRAKHRVYDDMMITVRKENDKWVWYIDGDWVNEYDELSTCIQAIKEDTILSMIDDLRERKANK